MMSRYPLLLVPDWKCCLRSLLCIAGAHVAPLHALAIAQQAPRAVTEEMRIVPSDVIPGMMLSRVTDLLVNDAGLIFVADAGEYIIRVFDPAGKLLRSFGRKGQGPGEWRGAFDLFGTIGDTLIVRDQNTQDLNFFTSDGKLTRTWSARGRPLTVVAYLQGNRVMSEAAFYSRAPGKRFPGNDSTIAGVVDTTGSTVRRVIRYRGREDFVVHLPGVGPSDSGATFMLYPQPFIPQTVTPEDPKGRHGFVVLPAREFSGRQGQVKLLTIGANGNESERILQLEVRKFQPADVDAFVKERADALMPSATRRSVPRASIEKQIRDSLVTFEYLNPAEQVIIGSDGSIWIRPFWSKTDWSVITSGNAPSFSVRVPPGARLMQVSADMIWTVSSDSDGLPIIARFRIAARQ